MSLISTTRYSIRRLTAEDAQAISPQASQASEGAMFSAVDWAAYLRLGVGWTLFRDDSPMVCAGAHEAMPGVVEAWAMVGAEVDRDSLLPAVRGIRAFLYDLPWKGVRRVQTSVRLDFAQGHRMAALLGFEREGVLRRYGPDGADFVMYSRI